jgi:hypothetical protein
MSKNSHTAVAPLVFEQVHPGFEELLLPVVGNFTSTHYHAFF